MNQIVELIRQVFSLFRFWIIVSPWEQAIRVRRGKHTTLLSAGIHFRIPVLDALFVQSIRQRTCCVGRQTITSSDGKAVTLTGAVAYSIGDVLKLYEGLHHAEETIMNVVRTAIAEEVSHTHTSKVDVGRIGLAASAASARGLAMYGIVGVTVNITEISIIRAYRLIGDYAQVFQTGTSLSTEKATS